MQKYTGGNIMFLHLGGDVVVSTKDVIGILDMDSTLQSKNSRNFLNICEEEGFVIRVTNEEPRSFVITEKITKNTNRKSVIRKVVVYYSPISAVTLQKRASFIQNISIEEINDV